MDPRSISDDVDRTPIQTSNRNTPDAEAVCTTPLQPKNQADKFKVLFSKFLILSHLVCSASHSIQRIDLPIYFFAIVLRGPKFSQGHCDPTGGQISKPRMPKERCGSDLLTDTLVVWSGYSASSRLSIEFSLTTPKLLYSFRKPLTHGPPPACPELPS